MNRRSFLAGVAGFASASAFDLTHLLAQSKSSAGFQLVDVTKAAGLQFRHNSGAYGGKLLPETLGSGCAFLDYDADGWQDILLINGADWPGHHRERSTLRLFRNNRNGTFSDVTKQAGLDVEMYGMGVTVGDYNNDGFPDIYITCVGQNRLYRNTGKEPSSTSPAGAACRVISRSALRRCGSTLIVMVVSTCSSATMFGGHSITTCSAVSMARQSHTALPKLIAEKRAGSSITKATEHLRTSPQRVASLIAVPNRSAWRCLIPIAMGGSIWWLPTTPNPTSFIATSAMGHSRTSRSKRGLHSA